MKTSAPNLSHQSSIRMVSTRVSEPHSATRNPRPQASARARVRVSRKARSLDSKKTRKCAINNLRLQPSEPKLSNIVWTVSRTATCKRTDFDGGAIGRERQARNFCSSELRRTIRTSNMHKTHHPWADSLAPSRVAQGASAA